MIVKAMGSKMIYQWLHWGKQAIALLGPVKLLVIYSHILTLNKTIRCCVEK